MANDILNTAGTATGTQKLGNVTMGLPGWGSNSSVTYDGAEHTIDVADIADKYDDRFDDKSYYVT